MSACDGQQKRVRAYLSTWFVPTEAMIERVCALNLTPWGNTELINAREEGEHEYILLEQETVSQQSSHARFIRRAALMEHFVCSESAPVILA